MKGMDERVRVLVFIALLAATGYFAFASWGYTLGVPNYLIFVALLALTLWAYYDWVRPLLLGRPRGPRRRRGAVEVKRLYEMLAVLLVAAQLALVLLSIYRALTGGVAQVYVADLPLLLPIEIAEPARAILRVLYEVFYWVLLGVVVVAGIQAALGLVQNFITAFLPLSIPRGSVNTLIRTVLGIFIIKAIVDGTLRYLGYSPGEVAVEVMGLYAPLPQTWTSLGMLALGAAAAAYLSRVVVEVG